MHVCVPLCIAVAQEIELETCVATLDLKAARHSVYPQFPPCGSNPGSHGQIPTECPSRPLESNRTSFARAKTTKTACMHYPHTRGERFSTFPRRKPNSQGKKRRQQSIRINLSRLLLMCSLLFIFLSSLRIQERSTPDQTRCPRPNLLLPL